MRSHSVPVWWMTGHMYKPRSENARMLCKVLKKTEYNDLHMLSPYILITSTGTTV